MKEFLITVELAQKIMDYLVEQPYKHTALLIQGLGRLEPAPEPEPPATKTEEKEEDGDPEPR